MEAMFTLTEPRRGHVPLVLDSPHSGNEYPEDFRFSLPKEALRLGAAQSSESLQGIPRLIEQYARSDTALARADQRSG